MQCSTRAVHYDSNFDKNERPGDVILSSLKDWLSHAAGGETHWSVYMVGLDTATNEQVGHIF